MAEVIRVMYVGLFVVGPPADEEAVSDAHAWLVNKGWSTQEADSALENRAPQLAWFCEEFGFVGFDHPLAIQGAIIQVQDVWLLGPDPLG